VWEGKEKKVDNKKETRIEGKSSEAHRNESKDRLQFIQCVPRNV
jgi:hypothetical protein